MGYMSELATLAEDLALPGASIDEVITFARDVLNHAGSHDRAEVELCEAVLDLAHVCQCTWNADCPEHQDEPGPGGDRQYEQHHDPSEHVS